jgi:DNA-binding ferritin-like protein
MKYIDKLISKVDERQFELAQKSNGDTIVTTLLNVQNQYRIYHWQTKSFSHHKAFGNIYELLDESIDELLETYFGKYGRAYATANFNLTLNNLVDGSGVTLANQTIDYLMNDFPKSIKQTDTDLLNLRDGIVGNLNRLKYLLTLG